MSDCPFTKERIGAIIGAYTGYLAGDFHDLHKYIEELAGRPVWTHELADKELVAAIKERAWPDFLKLAEWCGCKALPQDVTR